MDDVAGEIKAQHRVSRRIYEVTDQRALRNLGAENMKIPGCCKNKGKNQPSVKTVWTALKWYKWVGILKSVVVEYKYINRQISICKVSNAK